MSLLQIFRNSIVSRGLSSIFMRRPPAVPAATAARWFHPLTLSTPQSSPSPLLAVTSAPQLVSSCGMKMKRALRRRCKDCYFVLRDSRIYIMCPTHPRHKQMSFTPHEKSMRILTPGAMQSKQRPW